MAQTQTGEGAGTNVLDVLDQRQPTAFYWKLTILACLGGFLFGYDTSNIGAALNFVPYHLSSFWLGYLVAGASLGAAAGAVLAFLTADRLGRKTLLIADALIYAVGSILAAVTPNAAILLIARTLIGIAIGADSAIATAYIAEYAPSGRRGALSMLQQWMITVGILISYVVALVILKIAPGSAGTVDWRLILGLGAVPALIGLAPADPDARVAALAAPAGQVRAGPGRDEGVRGRRQRRRRGIHRRRAARRGPAPGADQVAELDPRGLARADRGLRVLHLPADHRDQHPAVLRPAPAWPAVPGQ